MADQSAAIKAIKDSVAELEGGLGQLADIMESTQQVSDGLLTSFRDFATTGSSNTLWNAVSRFSSGIFPGFWSLQNKIRAVAVYMQYVEKKQKEQIKREGEVAKSINKQAEVRMKSAETLAILNQETALKEYQFQKLAEDDYFKNLTRRMGGEEALTKYRKEFNEQVYKNIQSEIDLASEVIDRIKYEEKYQKMYQEVGFTKRKELTDALYMYEKERDIRESIEKLEKEQQHHSNFQLRNADGTLKKMTEQQKLQAKIDKENVESQLKQLRLEEAAAKASREFLEEQSGVKVTGTQEEIEGGGGVVEVGEGKRKEKTLGDLIGDSFKKKFENLNKTVIRIGMIYAIMKKQGIMKSLGSILKPLKMFIRGGLIVLGYVMMIIFVVSMLVFIAQQSGIIDFIIHMGEAVIEVFVFLSDLFTLMWEGITLFFGGIWDFIAGAFGGDGQRMIKGLGKMIAGVFAFFSGLFLTVLLGSIGLIGNLLFSIGTWIGTWMVKKWEEFKEKGWVVVVELLFDLAVLLLAWFSMDRVYKMAGGGTTGGIAVAAMSIAAIGIASMATGGRVNKGGNILVGEAGPEIVSLPANSFVTPAVQSRGRMGNNISVNVNGRVGASDAELNEIARKIGQKINRQMNQYGSSGYRA